MSTNHENMSRSSTLSGVFPEDAEQNWVEERASGKKLNAGGQRQPAPFSDRDNLPSDMYPTAADFHLKKKAGLPTNKVGSYHGGFDPEVYAANAAANAELRKKYKEKLSTGTGNILSHTG